MATSSNTDHSEFLRPDLPQLPSNWRWIRFSDICERVSVGHVGPTTEHFRDKANGVRFLRSQNVRPGQLVLETATAIAPEFHQKLKKSRLQPGDILFVRVGANRGDCCVVPEGVGELNCANIVFARPKQPTGFHGYFFQTELGRSLLLSASVGAAQGVINTSSVASMPVPFPPLPVQHRIASILSAYDDLIENNQRRIRILEEMARALYREWFVHLRFLGHETIPRIPSPLGPIPQGWKVVAFTEIADVLSGGTPKTDVAEYWNGKIPFFTPRDAPASFYVQDTGKHVTELGLSKCASELYLPDTVFITARGTVGKVALPSVPMAINQSCYALRGKPGIPQRFLFLMTLQQVDYLKTNTGGATFDTIVVDTFRRMEVVKPALEVVGRFARQTDAIFEQVNALQRQVQNLRQTCDLLLPRLLSGQLELAEESIFDTSVSQAQ
jgi:type I restriction enzyme S subunit